MAGTALGEKELANFVFIHHEERGLLKEPPDYPHFDLSFLHSDTMAETYWNKAMKNLEKLQTEIRITIAEMKANFQNWPPGIQPQRATAPIYRGNLEGWSLVIPEDEGRVGYSVELTVFSPSGQSADSTLTLYQQPGNQPLEGAEIIIYDDAGLPITERPQFTDERGSVVFQLWPGKHTISVTLGGILREISIDVVPSLTAS